MCSTFNQEVECLQNLAKFERYITEIGLDEDLADELYFSLKEKGYFGGDLD